MISYPSIAGLPHKSCFGSLDSDCGGVETLRAIPAGRASERHFRAVLEETDFRRKLPSDPKDTCDLADSGKRGEKMCSLNVLSYCSRSQTLCSNVSVQGRRRKADQAYADSRQARVREPYLKEISAVEIAQLCCLGEWLSQVTWDLVACPSSGSWGCVTTN